MGFFDRWRGRPSPASPHPATSRAETEQETVPAGHELYQYRTAPLPSIVSTNAVAWLAHLGSSSDEAEQELDTILAGVDALMQGARPRILLSTGSGRLSSLMAPNNPEVLPYPHGMLVWTVDAGGVAGAPRGASLVQRWLRCIYKLRTRGAPPLQYVFLHEIASPRARAVAALVRGLGLAVRVPAQRRLLSSPRCAVPRASSCRRCSAATRTRKTRRMPSRSR